MSVLVAGRQVPVRPREVVSVVRAEIRAMPRSLLLWFALLSVPLAFGAVAALLSLPAGDEVFGTNAAFEWGMLIAAYVLFVTCTSGLCLVSSLGSVFGIPAFVPVARRAVVMAVLCLVTGFGIIALDLHYPIRLLFGVILSPSPASPMWWMGTVYGIYAGFLVLELVGMFGGWHRIAKVGGALAMVTAVLAPSTLGTVFGVLVARPAWHGLFVPIDLVTTAVLSGSAILALLYALVGRFSLRGAGPEADRALRAVAGVLMLVIVAVMVLVAFQVTTGLTSTDQDALDATHALVSGPLAPMFLGVRVGLGLIAPLVILLIARGRSRAGVALAAVLVMAGLVADRLSLVNVGQIAPSTGAAGIETEPFALYLPSPVEIAILVAGFALVAFLYTLAERYLDLTEPAHGHPAPDAMADAAPVVAVPEPAAVTP